MRKIPSKLVNNNNQGLYKGGDGAVFVDVYVFYIVGSKKKMIAIG